MKLIQTEKPWMRNSSVFICTDLLISCALQLNDDDDDDDDEIESNTNSYDIPARINATSPKTIPQHQNVQQASTMWQANDWIRGAGSGVGGPTTTTEICCGCCCWWGGGGTGCNGSITSGWPNSTLTSLGFITDKELGVTNQLQRTQCQTE